MIHLRVVKASLLIVAICISTLHPCHSGTLDLQLQRLVRSATPRARFSSPVDQLSNAAKAKLTRTGLLQLHDEDVETPSNRRSLRGYHRQTYVNVFIEAEDLETLGTLQEDYGVRVNTVLGNGIITARVPVTQLQPLSNRPDIRRVEAAKKVKLSNEVSNGLDISSMEGHSVYHGMNNSRTMTGSGVVVGIVDTGIDWTHEDFIDAKGNSRILYYWDQSDTDNDKTPTAKNGNWTKDYGHEYTQSDFNQALKEYDHEWDMRTNYFGPSNDTSYPIKSSAQDTNGHGTHVAGTAAGNGRGSGEEGVASDAFIIFVKFDFESDQGSDASIVDAVHYIFARAAELGLPAVVNLSLGSDFGPHDGSTLEERAYNELVGPGRIVVAAAGNPGKNNWHEFVHDGYALHGSGNMDKDNITVRIPEILDDTPYETCGSEGHWFVFLGWYSGNDSCRIRVTTPSGATYPPSFTGDYLSVGMTGKEPLELETDEGYILVAHGGSFSGISPNNQDNEIFIEIRDVDKKPPAPGNWTIELIGYDTPAGGRYDLWHTASDSVKTGWATESFPRTPTPQFGGRQSDNKMTINSPATADKVIAVAAYTSRTEWTFYNSYSDTRSFLEMEYGADLQVGELAYFSGRGPRRDGVSKPDIAAPGVGIASSFSHFARHAEWSSRREEIAECESSWLKSYMVLPNLEAAISQGTSMASPNVAGAVALMLQLHPKLDDEDVRDLFDRTAIHDFATDVYEHYGVPVDNTDLSDTDTDTSPFPTNEDWGMGKLDVDAALSAMQTDDILVDISVVVKETSDGPHR